MVELMSGKTLHPTCQHKWCLRAKARELGGNTCIHYCTVCGGTRVISELPFDKTEILDYLKSKGYEVD